MTAPTWSGTPAEWDAERDRRAKAIGESSVVIQHWSVYRDMATRTMPPRPVDPPFTCGECGLTDNSVFNVGGTYTRFAHASAAICREQLKRELRALRDGPTPQYEVCGWQSRSGVWQVSTWASSYTFPVDECERIAKKHARICGGTAHAIYKRVGGDK